MSCNVVVALSDIFSFSQLGMCGEHGHWAYEVIRLYVQWDPIVVVYIVIGNSE